MRHTPEAQKLDKPGANLTTKFQSRVTTLL